jgi:hypothetical protein
VVTVLRYLDVLLIVLALPFVVLAGLPVIGYLAGGGVWIAQRLIGDVIEARAARASDIRVRMGVTMASIMIRIWLVALVILAVGLTVERADGAIAAITVLCAFTLYFLNLLIMAPSRRSTSP